MAERITGLAKRAALVASMAIVGSPEAKANLDEALKFAYHYAIKTNNTKVAAEIREHAYALHGEPSEAYKIEVVVGMREAIVDTDFQY